MSRLWKTLVVNLSLITFDKSTTEILRNAERSFICLFVCYSYDNSNSCGRIWDKFSGLINFWLALKWVDWIPPPRYREERQRETETETERWTVTFERLHRCKKKCCFTTLCSNVHWCQWIHFSLIVLPQPNSQRGLQVEIVPFFLLERSSSFCQLCFRCELPAAGWLTETERKITKWFSLRHWSVRLRSLTAIHPDNRWLDIFKLFICICGILYCLVISYQVHIMHHRDSTINFIFISPVLLP